VETALVKMVKHDYCDKSMAHIIHCCGNFTATLASSHHLTNACFTRTNLNKQFNQLSLLVIPKPLYTSHRWMGVLPYYAKTKF